MAQIPQDNSSEMQEVNRLQEIIRKQQQSEDLDLVHKAANTSLISEVKNLEQKALKDPVNQDIIQLLNSQNELDKKNLPSKTKPSLLRKFKNIFSNSFR